MKTFNNYIVEKLHIDRNTKIKKDPIYAVFTMGEIFHNMDHHNNYEARSHNASPIIFIYTKDKLIHDISFLKIDSNKLFSKNTEIFKIPDHMSIKSFLYEYEHSVGAPSSYDYLRKLEYVEYEDLK